MTATTFYYLCPDDAHPLGGVRRIYRHVEILTASGRAAAVLHNDGDFQCGWFHSAAPVVASADVALRPTDVLVVPEVYGPGIGAVAPGIPKVVFNQNAYQTFFGYGLEEHVDGCPYLGDSDVLGVMVVSRDNADYLGYAFPRAKVVRVPCSVDPALYFVPKRPKLRQVAFMPRKRRADAQQILNILRYRGALRDWDVVAIENMPEFQAAAIMRDSALFLSFSHQEGFGLPAAEALASGCHVIGYHGRGGREFLRPEFSVPVEDGDIIGFARAVERVLRTYDDRADGFARSRLAASHFIRSRYSPAVERGALLAFTDAMQEAVAGHAGLEVSVASVEPVAVDRVVELPEDLPVDVESEAPSYG